MYTIGFYNFYNVRKSCQGSRRLLGYFQFVGAVLYTSQVGEEFATRPIRAVVRKNIQLIMNRSILSMVGMIIIFPTLALWSAVNDLA